jgi:hypothetical protein
MADNVTPFSISAPGFYGLNLSDSPVDLSANFALEASNCVIDKFGRVASRKGWVKAHSAANTDLGTSDVSCIGELVITDGTATTVSTGGAFLFKLASASTLTTLTYGGGGVAPTISAANWQFCFLNGVAMFWQRAYDPLIYDPAVSATQFRRLNEKVGTAGTIPQCNTAIAAYGRVWAADTSSDKSTVAWSDLLTPHIWTGGTSGLLDLRNIWPMGGDEIVALAAHNGFLFIFGRAQILIYEGADVPSTMKLKDSIVGIGCIARDSVQNIGEDVWFLSDSGVRSLLRTIQEKSAPMRQVSKNVHDDLQAVITAETLANVKSGFSAVDSFYLLTMPTAMRTYCFDTRNPLQDGSSKTTFWSGTTPKSFYETKGRKFYTGRAGYIGTYSGYLDNASTYRMKYYTTWIDFGNPIMKSILKKIRATLIGGINQGIVFKWAYDFLTDYFTETSQITGIFTASEYGTAEYGIAEYSGNTTVNVVSANGSSSGQVLQIGIEADISGSPLSIQKIDLLTKDGRL